MAQAPIVYAGQGAPAAQVASLSGGGQNSYGYGAQRQQQQRGAPVDLRRPAQRSAGESTPPSAAPARVDAAPDWLERERVGPPYEANGRWYVPTPEPGFAEIGQASWYGPTFHGRQTASGEVFDQEALTAAHPTLPIPSLAQVTNLENGREIIVRINDRGPFVGDRLIDLSRRSAEVLGFEQAGQARVHVRYLGPAPRRVNADGAPAPASAQRPALPTAIPPAQSGPTSLLPPSAPVPAPAEPPQAQPAAMPPGDYFVQVGAYSDPANAQRARADLAGAGPVAVDVRRSAAGAELFRVRIGPLASREAAETARAHAASLGYGDAALAQAAPPVY